jgi:hypothetical protein
MPAFRVQVPVETGQNKAFGFVQPVGQSAWPFASHQHSRPPVRRRPTADVGANDKISAVPNYKNRRKCRQLIPALNQRVLKRCSRHAATDVSEHSGITVTSAFNESRDSIFWCSAIWQFQVTIRTVAPSMWGTINDASLRIPPTAALSLPSVEKSCEVG